MFMKFKVMKVFGYFLLCIGFGIFSKEIKSRSFPNMVLIDMRLDKDLRIYDNIKLKLKKQKNLLFVINFTSENCEPCNKEIPNLLNEFQNMDKSKVDLIFVFVGDDHDKIIKKTEELSIPREISIFSDPLSTSMRKLKIEGVPTTILVNSNFEILEIVEGYNEKKFKFLLRNIKEYTK
jgi:thiol-disulfide isomerase/thioredoxin